MRRIFRCTSPIWIIIVRCDVAGDGDDEEDGDSREHTWIAASENNTRPKDFYFPDPLISHYRLPFKTFGQQF